MPLVSQSQLLLAVQRVTKRYGVIEANVDVSLTASVGEIFGLLGPNGAGKTTLVRQIVGLARPDAGDITIAGRSVLRAPDVARRACSVQPQASINIDNLAPLHAIELVGRMRGASRRDARRQAEHLVAELDIEGFARARANTLSGGVLRLVSFAMAACVPGDLVILDEPTNDVDPLRRRLLWQRVRELADLGSSVLLVTHNVLEAERVVDRVAILDRGRIIRTGTPAALRQTLPEPLRLEFEVEPGRPLPELPSFLERPVATANRVRGDVAEENWPLAMRWATSLKNARTIETFTIASATLEDVYAASVQNGRHAEHPADV